MLHNLTVTNGDLQKIVAFEGAFERLFDIVFAEGGIEGGVVVQDCLAAIGTLLRFNSSNSVRAGLTQRPILLPQSADYAAFFLTELFPGAFSNPPAPSSPLLPISSSAVNCACPG